ncbi:MAG: class I SAM-dependent methyltransferase [Desulfobacterales bacterium]|nr:class I SAM-dependent methyltransferase [Desulfobacterales bacterium]
MPKTEPFQKYTNQYEQWFEENTWVYEAELKAVRALLPENQTGMEIGVGTGRFAAPLGIKTGVDPSAHMSAIAKLRGVNVTGGVAENLPFKDAVFNFVLMVTTVCFLDDINRAFTEARRVLSEGGYFIIGLVDRNSPIGQSYLKHQHSSDFYKEATFYSVDEILETAKRHGYNEFSFRQTIFYELSKITEFEKITPGYGKGSFVVIRGRKS